MYFSWNKSNLTAARIFADASDVRGFSGIQGLIRGDRGSFLRPLKERGWMIRDVGEMAQDSKEREKPQRDLAKGFDFPKLETAVSE